MKINKLVEIIEKKIRADITLQNIKIEDKSFLHKNHPTSQDGKFHIKLTIKSFELKKENKIQAYKRIYNTIDTEMKNYIHSIQILIR